MLFSQERLTNIRPLFPKSPYLIKCILPTMNQPLNAGFVEVQLTTFMPVTVILKLLST
jgi:hypothetical protein